MYLKTLTLRGFKSFASATRFEFEPGVTCVVGPNGSGKSNVVDALAWVMGEQGAKTLRGGKMEDVIFAGTTGRPALGRAEVSLTIDNSDGALPIEFSEVTITRTLFRNGGSEYAINGASCRLLDIQDLLSDSGLGREMHVIVGQGQLDGILRATPLERRGFIEEAAGVLKHRKRKEKALRKLESMQGNLLRLSDLIAELRRQLGPLGRQAHAARKAAVIAAQVRDSGLRLLADDLNHAVNATNDCTAKVLAVRGDLSRLEESATLLRARLTTVEEAWTALGPAATRASDTHARLVSVREQLRSLVQVASERQRHLGTFEAEGQSRSTADLEQQVSRASAFLDECTAELVKAQEALELAQRERQATHEQYARHTNQRDKEIAARAAHRDKIAQIAASVASSQSKVESLESTLMSLVQDISQAQERLSNAAVAGANALGPSANHDGASLADLVRVETALRDDLAAATRHAHALRDQNLEAEKQFATHHARVVALESALSSALGGAHALVEQDPELLTFSDHIEIPDEFASALAPALFQFVHSVVARTAEHARSTAAAAHAQGIGATTIVFPTQQSTFGAPITNDELEPGEHRACDVVTFIGSHRGLEHFLARVIIAPAHRAAALLERDPTRVIATREGEVLTSETVTSVPSMDRVFALRRDLKAEQERTSQLAVTVEGLRADILESDQRTELLQKSFNEAREQLRQVQDQLREHESAQARLQATTDAAKTELERLTVRRVEVRSAQDQAREQLARFTHDLENAKQQMPGEAGDSNSFAHSGTVSDLGSFAQLEAQIHDLGLVLERTREIETLARLDVRTAQEQHKNAQLRIGGLERALASAVEASKKAHDAAKRRELRARRAHHVELRAQGALRYLESSLLQAQQEREHASSERDRYAQELHLLRADVSTLENEIRESTSTLHRLELDLAGKASAQEQLEQRAVHEFSMAPQEVIAVYGPHQEVPLYEIPKLRGSLEEPVPQVSLEGVQSFDRSYLESIHQRSLKALASLGTVNPLALEEFTALEERHAFLNEQLEDLKKSRADLMSLVDEIDERVQQVFASAFADTAAQFSRVFPQLFPGGEGKMFLTEPEDLLNTGIEIEARPAGKKVKRLSLLSGGERSLTAIAMLVSIFMARPSPFYVMDEVEAALDDVNLGRLLGVFKELRRDSQLIVITHQKRTMEIADALYGVTMQGDGVSAVIGQRLSQ